jgi:hypothetical protein
MTTPPQNPTPAADPLARAPGLAVVASGAAMLIGALGWGGAGLAAAAAGGLLSLVNVWALHKASVRAVAQAAAGGPSTAVVQLTAALGAKTALLFAAVWIATHAAHVPILPFGLGLLVSVFSLLGAGLTAVARAESI